MQHPPAPTPLSASFICYKPQTATRYSLSANAGPPCDAPSTVGAAKCCSHGRDLNTRHLQNNKWLQEEWRSERCSRMSKAHASHSGDHQIHNSANRTDILTFFVVFLGLYTQILLQFPKQVHDHCLPHTFQFTKQSSSSFDAATEQSGANDSRQTSTS